ncbi:MFS transporter [Nocardioides halotolerans]|uniref:MFS transporter n=1 Tax=Nocardioides halotolerans TaxID=433660 RepID=UPI0003F8159B|nr:MFS transporter [Nocardioides halotolerans]
MTLTDRPEDVIDPVDDTDPVITALLAPAYRWATVGMVSLVFLAAFEALAVTTIMPSVSADLDGRAWFSAAFSATLAASVVGMVAGGLWSDRSGPRLPLLASVAVFAGGLLLAGLAPGIELFVAARFLQGLGGGAMTVALYVVVARIYAPIDHPRIFGAFAAAWVIPSMVGPSVAGVVQEAFGWRWVFLGVVALAVAATAMLVPALRSIADNPERSSVATRGRLALAAVVAGAVVALDLAGRAEAALGFAAAALALVVVLVAVRPLLPGGTLVVRRGLPAVVALRGAIAATFFSSEIYLPYLLQEHYDVRPWLSGATLTVGALGWAGASQVQARLGSRLGDHAALRAGAALLLAGIGGELAATALHLTPVLIGAAWVLAGAGMGLMFPRISAVVLAASSERDQGRNSAAMSISDAVGGATAISLTGLVFTTVGPASQWAPFVAVLSLTSVLAAAALLVSRRTSAVLG